MELKTVLKAKPINEWWLFFIVSIPMCALIALESITTDLSKGEGVSHMIGYSVRFAVPFIFLVVAASSVQTLFPGPFGQWWMRNRKYIGLMFAVAMAWQGAYIYVVSTFMRDYYFSEIYYFRDELEGTVGYLFLVAMIFTSFKFGRKYTNAKQWTLIQKSGVYFLWAYPFSVYWWALYYYPYLEGGNQPEMHDHIFYWMGFIAFAMRIAAWGKKRKQTNLRKTPDASVPALYSAFGGILIAAGLLASATGAKWYYPLSAFLTAPPPSATAELWLPFWPLEPFMPLFIIGLGTLLMTKVKTQPS